MVNYVADWLECKVNELAIQSHGRQKVYWPHCAKTYQVYTSGSLFWGRWCDVGESIGKHMYRDEFLILRFIYDCRVTERMKIDDDCY